MKVGKDIYLTDEEELVALEVVRNMLIKNFEEMPRWFFIQSEWHEYVWRKTVLSNRIRKLKAKIEYNTGVLE
jgi:hypothetical protein